MDRYLLEQMTLTSNRLIFSPSHREVPSEGSVKPQVTPLAPNLPADGPVAEDPSDKPGFE